MIQINLIIPDQPKRIESLLFYYLKQISVKLGAFGLFIQSPLVHLKLSNIFTQLKASRIVFLIHKGLESILLRMICNKTHTLHVNREHLMTINAEQNGH